LIEFPLDGATPLCRERFPAACLEARIAPVTPIKLLFADSAGIAIR
jgi:hypothetical protein